MTTDSAVTAKQALRRAVRMARRALPPLTRNLAAAQVGAQVIAALAARPPGELASYLALPDELDLAAVHIWWWSLAPDTRLWLPRVSGPGTLSWHPLRGLTETAPGAYGIREPDPARCPAAGLPATATVLVPGVAFTAAGGRLGQGGGFYDRLLAEHRGPTIGVGFACQLVPAIPLAEHDRRVDQVIIAD